jgi:hypothetical protein
MQGGTIRVTGDAGDHLAGALPGGITRRSGRRDRRPRRCRCLGCRADAPWTGLRRRVDGRVCRTWDDRGNAGGRRPARRWEREKVSSEEAWWRSALSSPPRDSAWPAPTVHRMSPSFLLASKRRLAHASRMRRSMDCTAAIAATSPSWARVKSSNGARHDRTGHEWARSPAGGAHGGGGRSAPGCGAHPRQREPGSSMREHRWMGVLKPDSC